VSRSTNPHGPLRAAVADRIHITRCDHGHVFLHLRDEAEETFAIAPFTPEQAIAAGEELIRIARNAQRAATGEAAPAGACVH
jgi:hypothetical protein